MKERGYDVYTVSADGPEIKNVLEEGVQHFVVPFTRKITPVQDMICLFKLISIIRKIKPDIIHTHTPKAGLLGMLAGRLCGIPVRMHTVAGLPLMETGGLKRKLLELTERITYSCAQHVYPNSRGLEKFMLEKLDVSENKIRMIGKGSSNGIDTVYFSSSQELRELADFNRISHKIHPDDLVFIFIGRVVRDKGIVELVNAYKTVRDRMNNEREHVDQRRTFLVVTGSFEQELDPLPQDIVNFLKEDQQVILTGFQHDIRPWLLASDIFVFPSYREGFPNVVMQASLLEVPSIVTNINGCNEIIQHNVSGLVIPVKDVQALATAMMVLAENVSLRRRFASEARQFVAMNFGRETVWQDLLNEYQDLTGRAILPPSFGGQAKRR